MCPKRNPERNEKEVLQVLQPPTNLKSLELSWYPCGSLPSWFRPQYLPSITSLAFSDCHGIEGISFSDIDLNEIPGVLVDNNDGSIGNFSSLADLSFYRCQNLSSLEQFLQHVPAVKRIKIYGCGRLVSLPNAWFADLHCLEELEVIDCSSLTSLYLSSPRLTSIRLQMWTLPALRELKIVGCGSLTFIGESDLPRHGGSSSIKTFSFLTELRIEGCHKLSTLHDLLAHDDLLSLHIYKLSYIPAVEKICVADCGGLQSLTSSFGSFLFLKDLEIRDCPNLDWRSGLVLPSSLERLSLVRCGDISACFPSCLESLTSLVSLQMGSCAGVASIPRRNIASLQELCLWNCPDLVSIGGAEAIAKIKTVHIWDCPKLKQPKQPVRRGGI